MSELVQKHDLGFIVAWLKRSNIQELLYNNRSTITGDKKSYKELVYLPLGIAVHWIAGNVPVLGVISLFQGLLTRNKNIVKAPNSFGRVLQEFLEFVVELEVTHNGKVLRGNDLLSCVLVVYVDRNDVANQERLSKAPTQG